VGGRFAASLFVGLVSSLACAEVVKISGRTVLPELPNAEITRWVGDQASTALVDDGGNTKSTLCCYRILSLPVRSPGFQ